MIPKLKMPGSKHSVLGIIQVTIDKIIVSITGFTTIDHRGTIALDEKLLNPTISQVTGSRINIKGKKGILDPVNNCQSIFVCIIIFDVPIYILWHSCNDKTPTSIKNKIYRMY